MKQFRWPKSNLLREQEPHARAVRDAIESLAGAIESVRSDLKRTSRSTETGGGLSSRQMREINGLIDRAPVPDGASEVAVAFDLTDQWEEIVRVELVVPEGKRTAVVGAVVDGQVKTPAQVETRIRIRSTDSTAFPAGRTGDFGLTSASFTRKLVNIDVGPDPEARIPVTIALYARSTSGAVVSDPLNIVSLSATATFFNE